MKVPKGKTLYFEKKVLRAGDEIPPILESKFAKALDSSKKSESYGGIEKKREGDNKKK